MGYTHYWKPSTADGVLWFRGLEACQKIIAASPIRLAGPYGEPATEPEVDEDGIRFNGYDAFAHETFVLGNPVAGYDSCKTAAKPYDLIVVACLAAMHWYTRMEVRSDGDAADWEDGVAVARQILRDPDIPNPISNPFRG